MTPTTKLTVEDVIYDRGWTDATRAVMSLDGIPQEIRTKMMAALAQNYVHDKIGRQSKGRKVADE